MALSVFLGVPVWRILGKQKRQQLSCPSLALSFFFPPKSFCLGVTLELRNNRTGDSQVTLLGQIISPNEKLLTRMRLHFGGGNDCHGNIKRCQHHFSRAFHRPELNYQPNHWLLHQQCIPQLSPLFPLLNR